MERFTNQPLRERPHLAVLFFDALGDFVVATPLLRGLREKYPGCVLDYFGGERTRELEEASSLIDARYSLYGRPASLRHLPAFVRRREREAGPYDLAINLDFHPVNAVATAIVGARYVVGACYAADGRRLLEDGVDRVDGLQREVWTSADFLARYGDVLSSQYIGEIFCRLARVETDYFRTEVPCADPPLAVPPILISTGASRSAKVWPGEYWREVIEWCVGQGLEVGLLGGSPAAQRRFYHSASDEDRLLAETALVDLRGRLTLPQVAGALARARACVTIDNGIMHLAAAVGTPTLAIFGASPWRLWAPRAPNLEVVLPLTPCTLCEEHRFLNPACLLSQHVCMESITPAVVIGRLQRLLARTGPGAAPPRRPALCGAG